MERAHMDLVERRKWLETKLGRELSDALWNELVGEKRARAGDMTWDEEEMLIGDAMSYLRVLQGGTASSGSDEDRNPSPFRIEHVLRREAFALCAAAMADEHPEVQAFREEVLGKSFPLTYGGALRFVDEDGHVRGDAPGGRRLQELVQTLATTYLWKVEDASWWVLCARYIPPPRTFGVETNVTRHEHGPEIGTITLTAEPWVPADIVAQRYKDAQRRMLGKNPRAVGRERLRLLGFVETMGKGMSWRERMELWNKLAASSKKERYEDVRNFSKAYKQVRALVLEPGYKVARRDERVAREARRRRIDDTLTSRGRY